MPKEPAYPQEYSGRAWQFYVTDGPQTLAVIHQDGLSHINLVGNSTFGRWEPGGTRRYYITDHLGSTRAVVDDNGNVLETFDYYPFGLLMPKRSSTTGNTLEKFTGKERDEAIGLDYFGGRFYDSALGRWTTTDPLADRFPHVSPYAYVENDPVNFFDPNGEYRVSPNGRSVYRVSRGSAQVHRLASYVPVVPLATIAYKALRNDPSYPITGSDIASAAFGFIARGIGRQAIRYADDLTTIDARIAKSFIKANRIATTEGLNLAINSFTEDAKLALDEGAFQVASKLGLGNQNIANSEMFQVFESLLEGFSNEQANLIVNTAFGNIVDGLRSLAVDEGLDLSTEKGIQGLFNVIQNFDEEQLDQFGVKVINGTIQIKN